MARTEVMGNPEQQNVALVLDHHEDDAAELSRLFDQVGWGCSILSDQKSLESLLRAQPFTAVVVREDFCGGEVSVLLDQISTLRPGQRVIVLQSSGHAQQSKDEHGVREYPFLATPVSQSDLEAALATIQPEPRMNSGSSDFSDFSEQFSMTARELSQTPLEPETFQRLREVFGADTTEALQVELAFQEALANAYEHGNLELASEWREEVDSHGVDKFSRIKEERLRDSTYANRLIQVFLSITDNTLSVEIQDEGPGFPFELAKSPNTSEEVRCHGRGRQLMDLVMDTVRYSDGGRRIHLTKKFSR